MNSKASSLRELLDKNRAATKKEKGTSDDSRTQASQNPKSPSRTEQVEKQTEHDYDQLNKTNGTKNQHADSHDCDEIALKAQVLRAFLKPKKTKKTSSPVEVDLNCVLKAEPCIEQQQDDTLEASKDLPEIKNKQQNIDSELNNFQINELETLRNENKNLASEVAELKMALKNQIEHNEKQQNEMTSSIKSLQDTVQILTNEIGIQNKQKKTLETGKDLACIKKQMSILDTKLEAVVKFSDKIDNFREEFDQFQTASKTQVDANFCQLSTEINKQLDYQQDVIDLLREIKDTIDSSSSSSTCLECSTQRPDISQKEKAVESLTNSMQSLIDWIGKTTDDIRETNERSFSLLSEENKHLRHKLRRERGDHIGLLNFQQLPGSSDAEMKNEYEKQLIACTAVLKLIRGTVLTW